MIGVLRTRPIARNTVTSTPRTSHTTVASWAVISPTRILRRSGNTWRYAKTDSEWIYSCIIWIVYNHTKRLALRTTPATQVKVAVSLYPYKERTSGSEEKQWLTNLQLCKPRSKDTIQKLPPNTSRVVAGHIPPFWIICSAYVLESTSLCESESLALHPDYSKGDKQSLEIDQRWRGRNSQTLLEFACFATMSCWFVRQTLNCWFVFRTWQNYKGTLEKKFITL